MGPKDEELVLDGRTRLETLTKRYPFLIDYLPGLRPEYAKLRSPFIRRTMGAIATLQKVAAMGEMDLAELLYALSGEIERRTGERVAVGVARPGAQVPDGERKEALKAIIRELHEGGDAGVLKERFAETIRDVSPGELASVEQSLIDEGMPEAEVKGLCSLHVEVFREGLDRGEVPQAPAGHPVHTYMMENRAAENLIGKLEDLVCDLGDAPEETALAGRREELLEGLDLLSQVDTHYLRKENQLFPALEAHGVTGPTQVMWAVHDDIRASLKEAVTLVEEGSAAEAVRAVNALSQAVRDMIYKEEHILFPMALEQLSEADWARVSRGEGDIGFAWVEPVREWTPAEGAGEGEVTPDEATAAGVPSTVVQLDTGGMTVDQLNLALKHLPVDITFVDVNDRVAYFSATPERIFPRSPGIIGREVQKCHPPKSVHVVERIVSAFKAGERDVAEFWLEMGGRFIHIRYFAVRDDAGTYVGTLEVSQDLTELRRLEGEQRLLDWK